jgi:cation transport ATPase
MFSFLYNTGSIPLAMSGLLNPLIAVSAMLLSSLTVIGNTLLMMRNGHQAPVRKQVLLPTSNKTKGR